MKVLITGDSHCAALMLGVKLHEKNSTLPAEVRISVRPLGSGIRMPTEFFADRGSYAEITEPRYKKYLTRLPQEGRHFDAYGLCAPFNTSRIYRNADWANFATSAMPGAPFPMSMSLFRRVVMDDQHYMLKFLDVLRRNGHRVFVVESPRPFRHDPALKRRDPAAILQLDREIRRVTRENLAALGIPVISVPEQCIDGEGYMLARFRPEDENDTHHGNAEYGALMITNIATALQQMQ